MKERPVAAISGAAGSSRGRFFGNSQKLEAAGQRGRRDPGADFADMRAGEASLDRIRTLA